MSDLIDRQAAIEVLNKLARDNFTLGRDFAFYLGALHDAADGIKNLPSAQHTDYSDGYADGYKQGLKDAASGTVRGRVR